MSKNQRNKKRSINFGKFEEEEGKQSLFALDADTTFSFKHICTNEHSPQQCSFSQLKSFNDKIRILSCLPWVSIDGSPRETNGYEILPRTGLSREVPPQVPGKAAILVFRFGGGSGSQNSGRIAGFKGGTTFYILFVDSKLNLYSH